MYSDLFWDFSFAIAAKRNNILLLRDLNSRNPNLFIHYKRYLGRYITQKIILYFFTVSGVLSKFCIDTFINAFIYTPITMTNKLGLKMSLESIINKTHNILYYIQFQTSYVQWVWYQLNLVE